MRERPSQLVQLRRRAVHFQADQVGHLERFREQRAHVVQMDQKAFGVSVSFAAENLIAVEREPIKKILPFARRFLNERRERGFEGLEFSRMHFEVGVKADEIGKRIHSRDFAPRRESRRAIVGNYRIWRSPPRPPRLNIRT